MPLPRACGVPPRAALLGGGLCLLLLLMRTALLQSGRVDQQEWSWSSLPQTSRTLMWRIGRELEPFNPFSSLQLSSPHSTDFSQNGQSCYVAALFANKAHEGTFLEAGAYDGELLSNSLFLERELGWTGLLVEPDPWNYWSLKKKNRKALSLNACLAPSENAAKQVFRQSDTMGRLSSSLERSQKKGIYTEVVCYPLYSVLRSANLTNLDYLALDLEGAEFQVLQTLPWHLVRINVLQVEASHLGPGKRIPHTNRQQTSGRDGQHLQEIFDREILTGESHDIEEKAKRGSCEYKKDKINVTKFTEEQKLLVEYLINKGYEFLEDIGEDFIFARSDFLQK